MKFAPIALFVYNRPLHTKRTIDALRENQFAPESDLVIYSDGARSPAQIKSVLEVRDYIRTVDGFNSVLIVEQPRNLGLSRSIISGVTSTVEKFGQIIVLEDDIITSPYFLKYMNDGLNLYAKHADVASIHAYLVPVTGLPETFFLRGGDCQGWATWKDRWTIFEPDGTKLLAELKHRQLTKTFDLNNAYPFTQMLIDQISGKNDSWAIRWHAAVFLQNKFTLYPGSSLLSNIGFDGSGENCGITNVFSTAIKNAPVNVGAIPIEENKKAAAKIENFYRRQRGGFVGRLKRILKGFWSNISSG
jgi:hypothetical protein